MEFPFNINNLFGEELCLIDQRLTPFRSTIDNARHRKEELYRVIDEMGKASARAQNLHGPITSAQRLSQSKHRLYIKKDQDANNGNGTVVGLLKVGNKKLFIYDHHGNQLEMEPLCVLDFYIHESCQRKGSGKQLFEYMLRMENADPMRLAIDRPSSKFLSFLQRHYDLRNVIPQVNNFVVFEGFFRAQSAALRSSRRRRPSTNQRQDSSRISDERNRNNLQDDRSQQSFDHLSSARGMNEKMDISGTPSGDYMKISRPPSGRLTSLNVSGFSPSNERGRPTNNVADAHRMGAQQALYSRQQMASPPQLFSNSNFPSDQGHVNSNLQRINNRAPSPPLLQRGGPSQEYVNLKTNLNYLDRRGHLRVDSNFQQNNLLQSSNKTTDTDYSNRPAIQQNVPVPYNVRLLQQRQQDTAMNVFGIPKLPLKSVYSYPHQNKKTALW